MFESLDENNINIKKLSIEKQEKKEKTPEEKFEELKESNFFDREKGQWIGDINKNQEVGDSDRFSEAQLSGVIAEALIGNKEKAKETLENLKESNLFDREKEQWIWHIDANQEVRNSNRFPEAQLSGVIAEAMVGNKEKAKETLKNLKESNLFDKEKGQWIGYINKNQEVGDSNRHSEAQLSGVIAESMVGNKEKAKETLENLKESNLFDKEKGQWIRWIGKNQEVRDSNRFSGAQLSGVIAETLVGDKDKSKEILKNLKESNLFDKEKGQWIWRIDKNQEVGDSDRFPEDQLLGVIAEKLTEEEPDFKEETPPIPEMRRF